MKKKKWKKKEKPIYETTSPSGQPLELVPYEDCTGHTKRRIDRYHLKKV